MKKNKVSKGLGIIGIALAVANAAFILSNHKKAKDLHKNNDVAVTYGEESIDMSGKGNKLECAVMFGSMTLDFRNCIAGEIPMEIEVFARFAELKVVVPEGWYVDSKGKITMAGVENFTATYEDEEASMLLRFNAAFAGITITNERYT